MKPLIQRILSISLASVSVCAPKIAASGGSASGHLAAATDTISDFGSVERFGVEAQVISQAHRIGQHTPPTLILHDKEDTTVPYASVVAFESVMKKAERPCKLVGYEGAGHGFFNRGEDSAKTLAEADSFLVDLGWLKK